MTQADKIKEAQQANLLKFAHERDLMVANPDIVDYKDEVKFEIIMCLANIGLVEEAQAKLAKRLRILEREKANLAKIAYSLQENGIFWAENEFSIKKPSALSDFKAMLQTVPEQDRWRYITKKEIVEVSESINSKLLKTVVPTIYKKTFPSIVRRTKKIGSGEFDDE